MPESRIIESNDEHVILTVVEPSKVRLGLWIDDSPKTVLTKTYFNKLKRMNITLLNVMIDDWKFDFKPTWTVEQLSKLASFCAEYNMDYSLVVWPYPDRTQLRYMFKWLDKAIMDIQFSDYELPIPRSIECDTEMNWKTSKLNKHHFNDMDSAGDYLVAEWRRIRYNFDIKMEQTTFLGHAELSERADVLPEVDIANLQMYSVASRKRYNPKTKTRETYKVPWNHIYGPGKMQYRTLSKALMVPGIDDGQPEVASGIALWNQKFIGHSIEESMSKAIHAALFCDPALELKVATVFGWSSKWLIGIKSGTRRQAEIRRVWKSEFERLNKEGTIILVKPRMEWEEAA